MNTLQPTYRTVAIAIVMATTFYSCAKEKTADDFDPPTITVSEPVTGQQFNLNDTIALHADIEDVSELADVNVTLIYGTDTVLLWPESPVVFGNVHTYHLEDEIINNTTVGSTTPAIIRFYAIDKHDNAATKDVAVELL